VLKDYPHFVEEFNILIPEFVNITDNRWLIIV
jgi:hypothetical protein